MYEILTALYSYCNERAVASAILTRRSIYKKKTHGIRFNAHALCNFVFLRHDVYMLFLFQEGFSLAPNITAVCDIWLDCGVVHYKNCLFYLFVCIHNSMLAQSSFIIVRTALCRVGGAFSTIKMSQLHTTGKSNSSKVAVVSV